MTPDLDFLKDVEAMAEFVASLRIDEELRGRVERVRCDVHDMRQSLEKAAERRRLRDAVTVRAYREAR